MGVIIAILVILLLIAVSYGVAWFVNNKINF